MALGVNPGGAAPHDRRRAARAVVAVGRSAVKAPCRTSIWCRPIKACWCWTKCCSGVPVLSIACGSSWAARIGQQYDVAIFDCPPAFGTLTMNALTAADLLLIPVPCDYFSARSLQQFLELVDLVQHNTNPALRYRILITMFDKRNRISHIIQDQIRRKYGSAVLNTFISIDTKLRESPVIGQPITQYAPNSRSAHEYHALATELMQDEQTQASSQAAA